MSGGFAFGGDRLLCCFNRAATLMSQHQYQAATQMIDRVFDATQTFIIHYVSRHSNDEQIAEPLVEDDLGWNARVRATDNDGERLLNVSQLCAPVRRLTGMLQTAGGVAAITCLELRDCFRWSY